jgi:hypothetical protein
VREAVVRAGIGKRLRQVRDGRFMQRGEEHA